MNDVIAPVYSRIALDIAMRIASGKLKENSKIYGRSVMASEYGVSPETIRRAMKLLEDMGIVEVRQNSGAVVLSAEKARSYADRFGAQNDVRAMRKKLYELLEQQTDYSQRIVNTVDSLVQMSERFSVTNPFNSYELEIPGDSHVIGRSVGELKFWQETAATIIAIRRGEKIILSPGPYATFEPGDILIFIGNVDCVQAVGDFVGK